MEQMQDVLRPVSIAVGGLVGYFMKLDFEFLLIYIIVMILDVCIAKSFAKYNGEFQSRKNSQGLYIKVAEFLLLLALLVFQRATLKIGIPVLYSQPFTVMFITKEIGSILETFARNDAKIPKKILNWFEKVKNTLDNDEIELDE